jgi:lipid II isoglutaminyl synthase (glutamine-hydrolysing)
MTKFNIFPSIKRGSSPTGETGYVMTKYKLNIAHLYPKSMNIYGDKGNIIALQKRCQDRHIKVNITEIKLGDNLDADQFDLFFAGGGQDRNQITVSKDLQTKKQDLQKAASQNKVFLLICGTYQLFGHYFKTHEAKIIPGISILDINTIASNQRKIGNVTINITHPDFNSTTKSITRHSKRNEESHSNSHSGALAIESNTLPTLVGFENHSGNTYINPKSSTKPLGRIISGFGNNGEDGFEGAYYRNCFGTYLHGSLLPKNPHFADFLIQKALETKYQKPIELEPLNDELEIKAHNFILKNRQ